MKRNLYWSEDYGCLVSSAFIDIQVIQTTQKKVTFDPTKCIIKYIHGFFELWYKGNKLRKISFEEYIKFKDLVLEVEIHE